MIFECVLTLFHGSPCTHVVMHRLRDACHLQLEISCPQGSLHSATLRHHRAKEAKAQRSLSLGSTPTASRGTGQAELGKLGCNQKRAPGTHILHHGLGRMRSYSPACNSTFTAEVHA